MDRWLGSAGVCVNNDGQILMVLQGKKEEKKLWSIPSGGKEQNETYEECCIREINEETGLEVEIVKPLHIKKGKSFGIDVHVHYFEVKMIGGKIKIQDPDELIHEIAWKSVNELADLELSFPEDRECLLGFIKDKSLFQSSYQHKYKVINKCGYNS